MKDISGDLPDYMCFVSLASVSIWSSSNCLSLPRKLLILHILKFIASHVTLMALATQLCGTNIMFLIWIFVNNFFHFKNCTCIGVLSFYKLVALSFPQINVSRNSDSHSSWKTQHAAAEPQYVEWTPAHKSTSDSKAIDMSKETWDSCHKVSVFVSKFYTLDSWGRVEAFSKGAWHSAILLWDLLRTFLCGNVSFAPL